MSNTDTNNLIIGGDWRVTLQVLDKRGDVPCMEIIYLSKQTYFNDGGIRVN